LRSGLTRRTSLARRAHLACRARLAELAVGAVTQHHGLIDLITIEHAVRVAVDTKGYLLTTGVALTGRRIFRGNEHRILRIGSHDRGVFLVSASNDGETDEQRES
jgi:hypothetical protein